jgi:hypothetical protein
MTDAWMSGSIVMNRGDPQIDLSGTDFDIHPIWYCQHSDNKPGVDFVFLPAVGAREVTDEVCQHGSPCIPLRVVDTELRCLGHYDAAKDTVFGLALWMVGEWRGFNYVDAPRTPVTIISEVPIFGVPERRFLQRGAEDWYAERIDG